MTKTQIHRGEHLGVHLGAGGWKAAGGGAGTARGGGGEESRLTLESLWAGPEI